MKLIVCEGGDDQSVLQELLRYLGRQDVTVEQCKGVDNLGRYLRSLPKRPEFVHNEVEALGVMIDADQDGDGAWRSLTTLVKGSFGLELGERVVPCGERPRIVGFVNGVNNRGTLEDVCLEALRGKPGFACLEEYFRCWEQAANCRPYPAKARFRAWMAAQADFDLRAGKAAEAGNLPWDSPAFGPLRDFLSVL